MTSNYDPQPMISGTTPPASYSGLSLVPLGAGDLIDRSVRFYRKYFWTFVLIATPPVVAGTAVSVAWTFAGRQIFDVDGSASIEGAVYYIFLRLGTAIIWLVETIATLVIMGGAARNFVRHLLFGETITFKETYENAGRRLFGLSFASAIITLVLGSLGFVIFYFALTIIVLGVMAIFYALGEVLTVLAVIVSVALSVAVGYGAVWLFFLAASRVAYVPQVMLVEGLGVFSAIGRSASLAGSSVRRLAALFVFSTVATYSALAILYVPLAWYASASGVEIMSFGGSIIPVWYEVAYNLIWQISFILLSPVWMIGLCLLYVDERVRSEGYDLELMAAANLGEIPAVPETYINPLQPALASEEDTAPKAVPRSSLTSLDIGSG